MTLRLPKKFEDTADDAEHIREILRLIFRDSGEPRGENCRELLGWALRRPEGERYLARWLLNVQPGYHEATLVLANSIAIYGDTYLWDHTLLKIAAIQTVMLLKLADIMVLNAGDHRLVPELMELELPAWPGDLIKAVVPEVTQGVPELAWLRKMATG